ncbi:MAG TPA: hypothetical protein VJ927_02075 [Actinomycetota bacterium]|nr:hypothetical protein [Actinomycetota bacterium]
MNAFLAARKGAVALAVLFAASLMLVMYVAPPAGADHEPANKVAAAGSEVEVMGPGDAVPILQETLKTSSPADLILQLTAECDILTDLTTGGNGAEDSAGAFGQVRTWITIDDKVVPVSSDDATETGKVVLCNRAHNKSVTDAEDPADGTDEERDMTQTRQANGFNWLALDTGFLYDNPANGNNILEIVVWAEFTEEVVNRAEAEALVGHRTLIVEPTSASIHEQPAATDEGGS